MGISLGHQYVYFFPFNEQDHRDVMESTVAGLQTGKESTRNMVYTSYKLTVHVEVRATLSPKYNFICLLIFSC